MTRRTDPYELLGVGEHATTEEINSAYRKALRRQHPDTRAAGNAPDASMADLQAARADLLRKAGANAEPDADPPPRPAWPRRFPARGFDIVVGPVRYHGPPRRRSS